MTIEMREKQCKSGSFVKKVSKKQSRAPAKRCEE